MGQMHVRGCFCTACKLIRVFTFLNGWEKKQNKRLSQDMQKLYKFQISVLVYISVYQNTATPTCLYVVSGCVYPTMTE